MEKLIVIVRFISPIWFSFCRKMSNLLFHSNKHIWSRDNDSLMISNSKTDKAEGLARNLSASLNESQNIEYFLPKLSLCCFLLSSHSGAMYSLAVVKEWNTQSSASIKNRHSNCLTLCFLNSKHPDTDQRTLFLISLFALEIYHKREM